MSLRTKTKGTDTFQEGINKLEEAISNFGVLTKADDGDFEELDELETGPEDEMGAEGYSDNEEEAGEETEVAKMDGATDVTQLIQHIKDCLDQLASGNNVLAKAVSSILEQNKTLNDELLLIKADIGVTPKRRKTTQRKMNQTPTQHSGQTLSVDEYDRLLSKAVLDTKNFSTFDIAQLEAFRNTQPNGINTEVLAKSFTPGQANSFFSGGAN